MMHWAMQHGSNDAVVQHECMVSVFDESYDNKRTTRLYDEKFMISNKNFACHICGGVPA